jgi:hypothetical protein
MRSEHEEQVILSDWLRANNYMFYKSPSETYTTSWKQKHKNKREWVTKGYPDVTIILKRWSLLFIELKKEKGKRGWMNWSTISQEQIEWQEALNNIANVQCNICHGASQAIELINNIEGI